MYNLIIYLIDYFIIPLTSTILINSHEICYNPVEFSKMKIYLVLVLFILNYYYTLCANGVSFNKYSGYIVNNSNNYFKDHSNISSALICLAYCEREPICLTAHYNEQLKICSLYDSKMDKTSLITQSLSVVYSVKSMFPLMN